jgi:DNA-binding NtrC family response regulator
MTGTGYGDDCPTKGDAVATVLYVDDERAIARALNSWLTRRGHTVFTASSIAEAKSILEAHPIDGTFIDVRLGPENGVELFEWLLQNQPRVAENTSFVTGDIIRDAKDQEIMDKYARPILVKPFELSELENIVKGWRSA